MTTMEDQKEEEETTDLEEWRDLMRRNTIEWDQGWNFAQKVITKLKNILESGEDPKGRFSADELMMRCSTICKMWRQKPPHDYSQRLYDKYRETFEEYITSTVLPSLGEKHDEFMLRELVKRWSNHKTMVTYVSRLFPYALGSLPVREEVGLTCFRDLVHQELNGKVRDAVISMIDQEREGKQIDQALLKNVIYIFVEIGNGQMDYYENVFEAAMLKDTAAYYSRKASNWILKDSCSDYRLKAEECLQREKDRVAHYLHSSSETKLLEKVQHELLTVYLAQLLEKEYFEKVQHELLTVYVTQLLGKEHCGSHALPRDDKVEDVSTMYRLFSKIPKVVEPIANVKVYQGSNGKFLDAVISLAEECLKREKDRVAHYLHSNSEMKLFEKIQREMLTGYYTQLLAKEHSGCHAILRDDKVEDLSGMYRLFSKLPKGLEPVSNIFKQHVTAEVTALVKQAEYAVSNKKVFVRKVIELHDKYLSYVNDCFMNHSFFHKALKEAFEVFCNKGVAESSSAELLATFCDNILRKGGSENLSDEAIEETLEKVVKLLAYISDKDLFAEFYRKKLARRLLFDKSANDEHERSMLTKLKQQCGGQFTSRMERMVTNLTLAREDQANFEEYLKNNPQANPGIDLTVTVLTAEFWPSNNSFDLNLPVEMVKCVEVFREFYQTKTKHRKLTWIYSLGTCNINGKFEPKAMELIVTTYQASVLLLFNTSDKLSYQEIMAKLNLSNDDIVRVLHSLSCAKYKILNKEPKTKTISPTDVFEFNSKFTDKMRRIKVPFPPVDEKKKVIKDVDKDRRYVIDASIVRIMKSRKVLGYQLLVMECVEQLGSMFKPDIKAIKEGIEDLINRDYLERDKDNPNLLKYLA